MTNSTFLSHACSAVAGHHMTVAALAHSLRARAMPQPADKVSGCTVFSARNRSCVASKRAVVVNGGSSTMMDRASGANQEPHGKGVESNIHLTQGAERQASGVPLLFRSTPPPTKRDKLLSADLSN